MSNPPNQQQFGTGRRFDETAPPVQVSGEWSHHAARQLLQAPEVPASATQYSPAGDADFPKVPISLKINWPQVVGHMPLEIGSQVLEFQTIPSDAALQSNLPWFLISGTIGGELFALVCTHRFALALAREHDANFEQFPADPADGALLMEYFLQPLLERVEASIGSQIILKVSQKIAERPDHAWLCAQTELNGEIHEIGIAAGPSGLKILTEICEKYADSAEKQISPRLIVKIGPVAMSPEAALTSGPGDRFTTGIDPSGEVRGILERSDGKFWPILVDDASVTITADLQPPLNPASVGNQVLVGFEIGDTHLSAAERQTIQHGSVIPVHRIDGNGVAIWLNQASHGTGHLTLVDGSLAVTIDSAGE